jgi:hypothetical protein
LWFSSPLCPSQSPNLKPILGVVAVVDPAVDMVVVVVDMVVVDMEVVVGTVDSAVDMEDTDTDVERDPLIQSQ